MEERTQEEHDFYLQSPEDQPCSAGSQRAELDRGVGSDREAQREAVSRKGVWNVFPVGGVTVIPEGSSP